MDQFPQPGYPKMTVPGKKLPGRRLVGGLPRTDLHPINVAAWSKTAIGPPSGNLQYIRQTLSAAEYVVRVCQCCPMGRDEIAVQLVDEGNSESAVRFLFEWVSDGEDEARRYLAAHAEPDGTSLIAASGSGAVGYAAIVWESNYAGFRSRGIPLVHQIAVGEPWRRRGIATLLMDAAEHLARGRGIATLGITVGLFDEYGPAQRMYGQRGYIPDGRGACRGQCPLRKGMQVSMDHDLIIWLTKDLVS